MSSSSSPKTLTLSSATTVPALRRQRLHCTRSGAATTFFHSRVAAPSRHHLHTVAATITAAPSHHHLCTLRHREFFSHSHRRTIQRCHSRSSSPWRHQIAQFTTCSAAPRRLHLLVQNATASTPPLQNHHTSIFSPPHLQQQREPAPQLHLQPPRRTVEPP